MLNLEITNRTYQNTCSTKFLGVSRVTRDRVRARARAGDGIRIHICQVNRRSVIRTHTYTQYRADRHVCICIGIGSGSINRDKC